MAFQEFFLIPTGAADFSESMVIGCEGKPLLFGFFDDARDDDRSKLGYRICINARPTTRTLLLLTQVSLLSSLLLLFACFRHFVVFHNLKKVIKGKFGGDATLIGDEGGFAPPCDVESGLEMIMEAAAAAGYTDKISVGLDVAASEFKVAGENAYDLDFKTTGADKDASLKLSGDEMIAFYKKLCDEYPIVTIEDPFDQDDWDNWTKICAELGEKVQIVGDDLTVTNPMKIQEAVDKKSANALLLKVNQIGSISESIDAVKLSKQNGWGVMTSHRSGETEDNYIADLAVGLCTGEIKTGAPCRGERTAKYNQLLRIEAELGSAAKYPGAAFRTPEWMG